MWDPPSSPNGIVTYQVEIQETDLSSNDVIILLAATNVTELELLLENSLAAYSLYTIDVTSFTSAGAGETQTVTLQTPEQGKSLRHCGGL